jgi:toxin ParE1/3/4
MAKPLIWSPRATNDLFEILVWIDRSSPGYSDSIADRFEFRTEKLPEHPQQGRRVPEYDGDGEFREVFVHRWRVIYEVGPEALTIVTIIHGARLLENAGPL